MRLERLKRMPGAKLAAAGLAIALLAGLFATFAGPASAANNAARGHAAKGCLAVMMAGNTIDTALSDLVKDGTLTQTQADAVLAKIGADAGKGAKTCAGMALLHEAGVGKAVEALLGVTGKDLKAGFSAGQSLTEIAASKSVDRATLVTTIETAINAELDKLVAGGKLSADRAATLKPRIATKVEAAVDAHPKSKTATHGMATPAASPAAATPTT